MTDRRQRLHFVWEGRRFPYFCRLAVESAVVAMPTAHVTVHLVGGVIDDEHLGAVARLPQVVLADESMAERFAAAPFGAAPYLELLDRLPTPAARSNLIRLAVLHRDGGTYLDTDVLVLRGLHDPEEHGAQVGQEWVWRSNRARVEGWLTWRDRRAAVGWALQREVVRLDSLMAGGRLGTADRFDLERHHRLQVNNAVIGAPRGSSFLEAVLAAALRCDPSCRFALGPSLLDDMARSMPRAVHMLPTSRFFSVPPGQSHRCFNDVTLDLPPDAQVLHYVASNHRRLLDRLDPSDRRLDQGRAPFWRVARAVRAAMDDPTRVARGAQDPPVRRLEPVTQRFAGIERGFSVG